MRYMRRALPRPLKWRWRNSSRFVFTRREVVSAPLQVQLFDRLAPKPTFQVAFHNHTLERSVETGRLLVAHLGSERKKSISDAWLRDCCRCPECLNADTMQRKTDLAEVSLDVYVVNAKSCETSQKLEVTWSDGHLSLYKWDLLGDLFARNPPFNISGGKPIWGSDGPKKRPAIKFSDVMFSEDGVRRMTDLITKLGLVFVDDTPHDSPEPTRQLLERIAFIRHTHYGGFYDFTADLAMADTAYTNIALGAHTDTTYFSDPVGLQAFHVLYHEPNSPSTDPGETTAAGGLSPLGGASLLVDGFAAARVLRKNDLDAYKLLCKIRCRWHASGNEGIAIAPDQLYPVLEEGANGTLLRIRWNNDDRGALPTCLTADEQEAWFRAAKSWARLLQSHQHWVQLKPGTTLIFDNWRVLHGRSAFTGKRRVCGGYINRDDFISRWRTTNLGSDGARLQTMGF